jgi:hypothetical protein
MDGKRWCSIWKFRYDIHQLTKPRGPGLTFIVWSDAYLSRWRGKVVKRVRRWLIGSKAREFESLMGGLFFSGRMFDRYKAWLSGRVFTFIVIDIKPS